MYTVGQKKGSQFIFPHNSKRRLLYLMKFGTPYNISLRHLTTQFGFLDGKDAHVTTA